MNWYTPASSELSGEMGYSIKIKLNGWHRSKQSDKKHSVVTTRDVLDLNQWRYNDKIPVVRRESRDEAVVTEADEFTESL
ncbi:hypothetical protein QA089_003054 [Meyerozyma guilliermondii]